MQQTVIKTYEGRERDAIEQFRRDAESMAAQGFQPISQSYTPGSYGCLSFVVALALCFIVIGLLVFVYMLIVKPAGTLTVTYAKTDQSAAVDGATRACPECAETIKAAALKCRFCGITLPDPVLAQAVTPKVTESVNTQRLESGSYALGRELGRLWSDKRFRLATYVLVGLYVLGTVGGRLVLETDSTPAPASIGPSNADQGSIGVRAAAYTDDEIADLIKASEDFKRYRAGYIKAVRSTIEAGKCTVAQLRNDGYWLKSQQHAGEPVYFLHCGKAHRDSRVYIDVEKGAWFK